jgi:predicted amidohydrolase
MMGSIDRFYAAACQPDMPNPTHRDEIAGRVKRMLELVEQAVTGYEPFFDVRLVVFPEFAHAAPIYPTVEELLDSLAIPIPNEHTQRYQEKAKQLNIYIQTGTFLEADPRWPGHVFNTTCLIGPDGIVSKYRKVHTWTPWEVHTSPHDLADYDEPVFPVADTENRYCYLLRLALPRGNSTTEPRRGRVTRSHLGVYGPVGNRPTFRLVDDG